MSVAELTPEMAVDIFKCLGDKTRFAIMEMLNDCDSYVELIADRLELTEGTVSFHLKKLERAGLVTCSRSQFYMIYSIDRSYTGMALCDFFGKPAVLDRDAEYKARVISGFIDGGRLTAIPSQMKKREIVWEYILRGVEVGQTLREEDVNGLIRVYHDDVCTIRRDFISLGIMSRDHEIYKRLK